MLRGLMLVSGVIEIVFGIAAILGPDPVIEAIGGSGDVPRQRSPLSACSARRPSAWAWARLLAAITWERPADSQPPMGLASTT